MKPHGISRRSPLIVGLLAIAAGILLIAFNADVFPIAYKSIIFSWQMLVIVIGVALLFSRHKRIFGVVMILAGVQLILPKFGIELSFLQGNGWAVFLIIAGILILHHAIFGHRHWRHRARYHRHFERRMAYARYFQQQCEQSRENSHDYIEHNSVFGSSSEKVNSQNFKGGDINCVFGSIEIDMTGAQLAEGTNILEINTVFGGVTLYIPAHWKVELRQNKIFGQFEDNRLPATFEIDEKCVLLVSASSIFGGGEIKSK